MIVEELSSESFGPMPHAGLGGERHFVTFIDVAIRFAEAIPVVSRDEMPELIDATFNNFRDNYGRNPKHRSSWIMLLNINRSTVDDTPTSLRTLTHLYLFP